MAKTKTLEDLLKRRTRRTSLDVGEPGLQPIAAPVDTFAQPALRLPPNQKEKAGRWVSAMSQFNTGLADLGGKVLEEAQKERDIKSTEAITQAVDLAWVKQKDGTIVKVKYLTGQDSARIAALSDSTAEQNTAIVAYSVVWDDDRSDDVKEQWARGLSLADRKQIITTVLEDQPGPTLEEVEAPCGHCDENIVMIRLQCYWIGPPFYSVKLTHVYWEYDSISQGYPGYSLDDIRSMSVRQRSFWAEMSKWRNS